MISGRFGQKDIVILIGWGEKGRPVAKVPLSRSVPQSRQLAPSGQFACPLWAADKNQTASMRPFSFARSIDKKVVMNA
jgi:hypothetical protein